MLCCLACLLCVLYCHGKNSGIADVCGDSEGGEAHATLSGFWNHH